MADGGGNEDAGRPAYGLSLIMMSFLAIGLFNAGEIVLRTLFTFRRRAGLYFHSMLAASAGILVYACGFAIKHFVTLRGANWAGLALDVCGWVPMITGQSLALYSRLHIVVADRRRLRAVFYLILADALLFHVPTVVLTFLGETSARLAAAYAAYEKVELTAFSLQECVISGLYIYETWKLLGRTQQQQQQQQQRDSQQGGGGGIGGGGKRMHELRQHLIYVNAAVIVMDATLVATQYANQYRVQTSYKAFVYSVKLKLEFTILNRLVAATRKGGGDAAGAATGSYKLYGTSQSTRLGTMRDLSAGAPGMGSMQGTAEVSCSANNSGRAGSRAGRAAAEDAVGAVVVEENAVMKTTEVRVETHDRDEEMAKARGVDDGEEDEDEDDDDDEEVSPRSSGRTSSEAGFAREGH